MHTLPLSYCSLSLSALPHSPHYLCSSFAYLFPWKFYSIYECDCNDVNNQAKPNDNTLNTWSSVRILLFKLLLTFYFVFIIAIHNDCVTRWTLFAFTVVALLLWLLELEMKCTKIARKVKYKKQNKKIYIRRVRKYMYTWIFVWLYGTIRTSHYRMHENFISVYELNREREWHIVEPRLKEEEEKKI